MFWELLSLITVIFFVTFKRWKIRKLYSFYERYKTKHVCLPVIGQAHLFLGKNKEGQMKVILDGGEESYKNGGFITYWIVNRLYVGVTNPVIAELVLKNCLEKDNIVECLKIVTGNGSIFAPVSIWRKRRKIISPAFNLRNINHFVKIFNEKSEIMVSRLREVKCEVFSIWKYYTAYAMDSVCGTTLGINVHAQLQPDLLPFLHALEEGLRILTDRAFKPWLHNDAVYRLLPVYNRLNRVKKIVFDFINEIIQKKKSSLEQLNANLKDKKEELKPLLEYIIESSKVHGIFGDQELREETLIIMMAGIDTTAVGSSFISYLLSIHPNVQDKCIKELQDVFGESMRPVTVEDLPQLKYLDSVIRESLRLYPSVPFVLRKVEKDLFLPTGDILPEGCNVCVNIYGIHRNPEFWGEDANQFRPERFLNLELKHPTAFIPFSYGSRGCLGSQYAMMSIKTVISNLLRNYRLLPAGDCSSSQERLRLEYDIMMRHVDNYPVRLEPRRPIQ